jgi:diguanylate cyclase (GGDEF)-like protein
MPRARPTTSLLTLHVAAVIAVGTVCAIAVVVLGLEDLRDAGLFEIVLFAAFTFGGEVVPIRVIARGGEGEISTSAAFAFALMIAGGPLAALIGLAGACVIADLARGKQPLKVAFNAGQYAITVAITGLVMNALSDVPHYEGQFHFLPGDLPAILIAAVVFYMVNTILVSTVIALSQGVNVPRYVLQDLLFQASTSGLLLGLSPLVVLAADFALPSVALLALPLLAIHRGGREAIAKEHQALHDALTGLPNRVLFREHIDHAISQSRRAKAPTAVMLIDLDHFKEINDTLGHHAGDRLLEEVARRLNETKMEEDTVARLGGDEFGVLLPVLEEDRDPNRVASMLLDRLREPFMIDGLTLEIDASIGIACFPANGDGVETLLQRADIAMYAAKESGSGFAAFEARLDRYSPRRLSLAGGLRAAIQDGEIVLHFQPKADLATGRIVGVEALARWEHPRLGLVGPSEFVPIAEQTGLIAPLTSHVLDAALRQVRQWSDRGLELSVAVNLSARSFLDTQLAVEIPRLLERWNVDAVLLELEITESMLMLDPARAQATLDRLSAIGLTLSVDDFGTGYSSLANLKRLPVDVIKIDKSFVMDMAIDPSDAAIVRSTIDLAHNLGLRVVAEGVESHQAWQHLAELGCDLAQGYYLSRPVPAESLNRLLAERHGAEMPDLPRSLRVLGAPTF